MEQNRQPKGTPIGGEFAHGSFTPAGIDLDVMAERHDRLNELGYVPATATGAIHDPSSAAFRGDWWDHNFATAEMGHSQGEYPKMPDDNTPSRTSGLSTSGLRRTHRMKYEGAGVTLRMPSATALRRFDKENGKGSFDVPVSATYDNGKSVSGWVRVTRNGNTWNAEGVNFPDGANEQVAESVSAVMSARHPTMALRSIGDITEHRRNRLAAEGMEIKPPASQSTWIAGIGYDEEQNLMVMETESGRYYGYETSAYKAYLVANAHSSGRAFNEHIKGQTPRVEVVRCPLCAQFTGQAGHTCPARATERTGETFEANERARQRAEQVLAGAARVAEARRPIHEAKEFGSHTVGGPTNRDLPLGSFIGDAGRKPLTAGEKHIFGRRGFTSDVVPVLRRHVSEQYVPEHYGTDATGYEYKNGGSGLAYFNGVDAKAAAAMRSKLPPAVLDLDLHDGPKVGRMLQAVETSKGRYEAGGYIVPPSRLDERVSLDTLMVFEKNPTGSDAEKERITAEVVATMGGSEPDHVALIDTPWRPGEKAYRIWWD